MMDDIIKVLIADDEKVVRNGCSRVLIDNDCQVLCANNGQEAMEMLSKEPVDIILLDLKMPVMSGEEALEIIRIQYPDIPVIIITGHGTVDTAVECMKKGAYDFITKPFQVDQFIMTIKRAYEKRMLEKKARQFQEENIKNLYDLDLEKSRLKTMINCMANGVMITNRNMEIVLHNPALLRLLEIPGKLENPTSVTQVINDNGLLTTLNNIQNNLAGDNPFVSQEIKIPNKTLRAISAPAKLPDNSIVGSVTVLEDITVFIRLDEMKSDFINLVAHELRAPIAAIRQQDSVLLEGLAGPLNIKQEQLLKRGLAKIDQLLGLINDLLDMAGLEAGEHVQHRGPTDIACIIKDTIKLMEPKAKAQGIELCFQHDNLDLIQADPKGIEEMISNLIVNAINYSPDGGRVIVTAKCVGGNMEIKVQDPGVGIDEKELPKIFDKFYRVKHPKTRHVMGTGLGLSIVKGIIEAHNGSIDVESMPGKGAIFTILLPFIQSE